MVIFSLIIPVYNVERYIDNCIKSVILQKPEENDMEVILVDDGSTDKSGEICDKYAYKYAYMRVIHKENGGLSSARNEGLHKASGKYILFMDSDDWWNPDVSFNKIAGYVKQHEETEMFLFAAYDFIEGDGYYKRNDHDNLNCIMTTDIKAYYRSLLDNGNLEVSAYTKIVKRDFLIENGLFFKEGLLSEDNEWMMRLLRKLKKVSIIDEALYIYRMNREGSITSTIKRKNIEDLLKIIRSSQRYYEKHPQNDLLELELCYSSYLWFSALGLSTLIDKNGQRLLRKRFRATADVCAYSDSPKTRLCYSVYKMVGLTMTSKILGIYIKSKERKQVNRTRIADISSLALSH